MYLAFLHQKTSCEFSLELPYIELNLSSIQCIIFPQE